MPWLALPFGDARKGSLSRLFKVRGIPMLVAIGPTGRTVTTETRNLVMCHGADAYPFTEERIKEIEAKYEDMAKAWPEKVNHGLHDHELVLTKCLFYNCDGCNGEGGVWSFYCEVCDFHLHPECALEENKGSNMDAEAEHKEHGQGEQKPKDGCICDGEVAIKLEKVKLV